MMGDDSWMKISWLEGSNSSGVEIALIRLSGLSKYVAGQVDCPTEVIRRISW